MNQTLTDYEEKRKIAVKYIVTAMFHNQLHFMCKTNWSLSYSAGVEEFKEEGEAIAHARMRTENSNYDIQEYNEYGERIK